MNRNKTAILMIAILVMSAIVPIVSAQMPVTIKGKVTFEDGTGVGKWWLVNVTNLDTGVLLGSKDTTIGSDYNVATDPSNLTVGDTIEAITKNGSWSGRATHVVQSGENVAGVFILMNITVSAAPPPEVVINEFSSYNTTGDWIELYNKETSEIPLDGWSINDSDSEIHAFTAGDSILADVYLFVDVGSRLNRDGDTITLLNGSVIVDQVTYGTGADEAFVPSEGNSTGRYPNGEDTGNDASDFIVFGTPTPGAYNELPEDTTPPASVTDLNEIAVGCTWINWSWTNPPDTDFSHVMVYDGYDEWKANVSGVPGAMGYINTSDYGCTFAPNTTYEIRTWTVDIAGNVNLTWVNDTATTLEDTEPPIAVAKVDKPEEYVEYTFTFDGSESTDNVGIVTYEWDFGDGTTGDGETTTHSYSSADTYTVTLTVTDGADLSDDDTLTVTVKRHYVGGGGGAPRDTDGDGYTDIQEMLAGTDKDDPCDPNPECTACLATKPAATPTPTATPTLAPTAKPTTPPVPTPEPTAEPEPTATPEPPGFEAVFAIAGLLAVAYLVLRRKRK